MRRLRSRAVNLLVVVVSVALALCLGALALRPYVERAVRNWIAAEAGKRDLAVHVGVVRVGLWPPLRLKGVSVESRSKWRLTAEEVEGWWRSRSTLVVKKALFQGSAGITVAAPDTEWEVEIGDGDLGARLVRPYAGLVVKKTSRPDEHQWSIEATELPVDRIFDLRRFEQPVADVGTISGTVHLIEGQDSVRFEVDLASRAARLPALEQKATKPAALGGPTEIKVEVAGSWKPADGALDVPRWSARIEGAAASGSLTLRDIRTDPGVDLVLEVERVDFARLLHTWGLEAPESLRAKAAAGAVELGSATLSASVRGRVSEPAAFVVTQKLDFSPPRPVPPAVLKLQGDFTHQAVSDSGAARTIVVSPSSPDFIPLDQVPPLFLRALLIAEDAGFYGHSGIDLREVPSALITDWTRGGAARGASTITQQLAKNLFLSREKHLGRKVQELSITLLLEAELSKRRILEIYLNVIEWGPGLYGLRPAARTYFDREPADLTPAQMAFLISIIPGPLKYQSSFAHGTPGPGLRKLVDNLLAKLRSVDALTEEEYQAALAEGIVVSGRQAPASQPAGTTPETPDESKP